MLLMILALFAEPQDHPGERPRSALEWLDHYDYCLDVSRDSVLQKFPDRGLQFAAQHAVIRCWPVQSSAKGELLDVLTRQGKRVEPEQAYEIADRLLVIVATAFAARNGMKFSELGKISAE